MVIPSKEEVGCLNYNIYQYKDEPKKFMAVETWASDEALEGHKHSSHYAVYKSSYAPVLILNQLVPYLKNHKEMMADKSDYLFISKGEDILWVSKNVGHKDVSITLKKYVRYIDDGTKQRATFL